MKSPLFLKKINKILHKSNILKLLKNKHFLLSSIIFFIVILALHDIINNLIENITIFSLIFLISFWISHDLLISFLLATVGLIFNMAKIEHFKETFDNKLTDDDIKNINPKKLKKPKSMNFKKAQENTYELINTMTQLKETLSNMSPTIKEGMRVMKMLKKVKK